MTNRPTSITVIGWYKTVSGVLAMPFMLWGLNDPLAREMMAKNSIPIPVQYVMAIGGLAISVVCGILFLRGVNWSRYLWVAWTSIMIVIGLVTSPFKFAMIPGVVVFLLIAFFLFRPKANAFFTGAGADFDSKTR